MIGQLHSSGDLVYFQGQTVSFRECSGWTESEQVHIDDPTAVVNSSKITCFMYLRIRNFQPCVLGVGCFLGSFKPTTTLKTKDMKTKPPWILPTPYFFSQQPCESTRHPVGQYPTLFGRSTRWCFLASPPTVSTDRGHASAPDGSLRDGGNPFAPRQRGGGRGEVSQAAAETAPTAGVADGKFFHPQKNLVSLWVFGNFWKISFNFWWKQCRFLK